MPGTLAPMYQLLAVGYRVMSAQSLLCWTHPSCAVWVGSMARTPVSSNSAIRSAIQSTCCSIDTAMFDSTDGLPGPVTMNRLGNPTVINPR